MKKVLLLLPVVTLLAVSCDPGTTTQQSAEQQPVATQQTSASQPPSSPPTPVLSPTADWPTAYNNTLGFSIQYPKNWNAHINSDTYWTFLPIGGQDISLAVTMSKKSLKDTQAGLPIFANTTKKVEKTEIVTVNNVQWTKLTVTPNQVIQLTNRNGTTYVVQYATFEPEGELAFQTFKFTN